MLTVGLLHLPICMVTLKKNDVIKNCYEMKAGNIFHQMSPIDVSNYILGDSISTKCLLYRRFVHRLQWSNHRQSRTQATDQFHHSTPNSVPQGYQLPNYEKSVITNFGLTIINTWNLYIITLTVLFCFCLLKIDFWG